MRFSFNRQSGLTLIETLVASAIFVVFAIAIYQLYTSVFTLAGRIRVKTMLGEIASEQFEFIRNLAYADVGTEGGIPSGVVEQVQTVTRNGIAFTVTTTIRNIDDPADGTIGGVPNDLSPADKKLVEVEVSCAQCKDTTPATYTSVVAPKNLETENGNGALVVRAIDANGQPVTGATVRIVNGALSPAVDITDVTDMTGALTIVDAPPSAQAYEVSVTKAGYSAEETHTPGEAGNPNPTKPHLTVAANTITQSTFSIDQTATYQVRTQDQQCAAISGISGTLTGTKLIGTAPDVIKNVYDFLTSGSGDEVPGIEWDTYALAVSGTSYDVAGTNPISPFSVSPGINQDLTITLAPNDPYRLVVGVVDAAGLPLAGADVEIDGPSGTFNDTTGVGSVSQTDWSGGGGQLTIGEWDQFYTETGIDFSGGSLTLAQSGTYLPSGELTSSTIDLGDGAVLQELSWLPSSQPLGAGVDPVRFQLASSSTNDETTVWTFVGPDGTADTFYTETPATVGSHHDGMRYIRYRAYLSTADTSLTPSVTDVAITYTAGCLPPGQVSVGGLSSGTYTVTVSKTGFQTVQEDITLSQDTYETITLQP